MPCSCGKELTDDIDRLVHHCHMMSIRSERYRLREMRVAWLLGVAGAHGKHARLKTETTRGSILRVAEEPNHGVAQQMDG